MPAKNGLQRYKNQKASSVLCLCQKHGRNFLETVRKELGGEKKNAHQALICLFIARQGVNHGEYKMNMARPCLQAYAPVQGDTSTVTYAEV